MSALAQPVPIVFDDRPSLLARSFVAMSPVDDGTSPRREEIVSAAKRLFAAYGYDATSIKEIADEVGLLKGSLYYHVSSKDEILTTIVGGFLAACVGMRDHIHATGGSPRTTLRRFVAGRRALHTLDWRGSTILAALSGSLRTSRLGAALMQAEIGDRRFLQDLLASGPLHGNPATVAGFVLDLVGTPGIRHDTSDAEIDRDASACADFVLAALDGTRPRRAGASRQHG